MNVVRGGYVYAFVAALAVEFEHVLELISEHHWTASALFGAVTIVILLRELGTAAGSFKLTLAILALMLAAGAHICRKIEKFFEDLFERRDR